MRTLAFLAASLLLVLLAQAEPLWGSADQAEPEMQGEEEDQVAVISFPVEERPALQDGGPRAGLICRCTQTNCRSGERMLGVCTLQNQVYRFCCR